jgi:hypothetical protein
VQGLAIIRVRRDKSVDADAEHLIRYLVAHMKCAACHRPYQPDDFQVMDEGGALLVILITCHHCHAQGLLVAFVQEQGLGLELAEASLIEKAEDEPEPITTDDVLDLHRFLTTFAGDFHTLFEDSSPSETQGEEVNGRTGHLAEGDA